MNKNPFSAANPFDEEVNAQLNPFANASLNPFEESGVDIERARLQTSGESKEQYSFSNSSSNIPVIEIYKYRVVYPGGTFVRISPHFLAEKAGEILECGTILESTRSLFLDGVNYVCLNNPPGWIFVSRHNIQVLELVDIVRIVYADPYDTFYSPDRNEKRTLNIAKRVCGKLFHVIREDSRYWRAVRLKCEEFKSFDCIMSLATSLDARPPEFPDTGPARVLWLQAAVEERDGRIRICIARLAAIAKQSTNLSSVEGLEACLWLFLHLRAEAVVVLGMVVDAANARFEAIMDGRFRSTLLSMVLDAGAASRPVTVELARLSGIDLLPDDIRNFLQRWIIIKCTAERERSEAVTMRVVDSSPHEGSLDLVTAQSLSFPSFHDRTHVIPDDRSRDLSNELEEYQYQNPPLRRRKLPRTSSRNTTTSSQSDPRSLMAPPATYLWREMEKELLKISDPTVQYARLI